MFRPKTFITVSCGKRFSTGKFDCFHFYFINPSTYNSFHFNFPQLFCNEILIFIFMDYTNHIAFSSTLYQPIKKINQIAWTGYSLNKIILILIIVCLSCPSELFPITTPSLVCNYLAYFSWTTRIKAPPNVGLLSPGTSSSASQDLNFLLSGFCP